MSENKGEQLVAQTIRTQAKVIKIVSWMAIIVGIPLSLILVGIPIFILGCVGVWYSKRMVANSDQMAKSTLDNVGAVLGEIKKRSS